MLFAVLACATSTETVRVTGEGRLHHVISGATWEDPDLLVRERVPAGSIAAAVAGSTLRFGDGESGVAVPRHEGETLEFADELVLPEQVGIWDVTVDGRTIPVVTTWTEPLEDTPLYQQMLLWSGEWLAGMPSHAVTDDIEVAEDTIALATLRGMEALSETDGRSYGPFPRPKEKDNQAHVWLDFKRSACGEHRGAFMAFVEAQGVDAQWVLMSFRKPSPEVLSMYETRHIAAVGREAKAWQHYNHVAVEVNGQVYDPSYALHAPDWNAYEDDLFGRYCYGEVEKCKTPGGWCQQPRPEGTCVDNPAGFDTEDPVMAFDILRGDNY